MSHGVQREGLELTAVSHVAVLMVQPVIMSQAGQFY